LAQRHLDPFLSLRRIPVPRREQQCSRRFALHDRRLAMPRRSASEREQENAFANLLDEKDRMLGAIGHDLRTPLASLRIRVETVEPVVERERIIETLDEMTKMIETIFWILRVWDDRASRLCSSICRRSQIPLSRRSANSATM
jgi:signal transduction histidine kinase